MSQVKFSSLQIGDVFKLNNAEYKKIPKVKVSCCRFTNAQSTSSSQRVGLKEDQLVEVVSKETE